MEITLISISFLGFVIAIALSFVPVYVSPVESVRTDGNDDEHDKWIYRISVTGMFIILLLPLLLASPIWYPVLNYLLNYLWVNHLSSFLSMSLFFIIFILPIVLIILFSSIHNWMTQMLRSSARYGHRRSIRPLRCMRCKASLKKLDMQSALECLSPQEQVAAKLGSVVFEVWCCHHCYVQPRQHAVHLRAYIRSQTGFFRLCPSCKEITMTKDTTKVIEEVTYDGGELLHIYVCQYCSRTEEHSETIYPRDTD